MRHGTLPPRAAFAAGLPAADYARRFPARLPTRQISPMNASLWPKRREQATDYSTLHRNSDLASRLQTSLLTSCKRYAESNRSFFLVYELASMSGYGRQRNIWQWPPFLHHKRPMGCARLCRYIENSLSWKDLSPVGSGVFSS